MEIASIISLCVLGISTLISLITTIMQKVKAGKLNEVNNILSNIAVYVAESESIFGAGNGNAKLQYVMNKVKIDCLQRDVEMSDEDIITQIESVLSAPQKKTEKEVKQDE